MSLHFKKLLRALLRIHPLNLTLSPRSKRNAGTFSPHAQTDDEEGEREVPRTVGQSTTKCAIQRHNMHAFPLSRKTCARTSGSPQRRIGGTIIQGRERRVNLRDQTAALREAARDSIRHSISDGTPEMVN